MSVTKIIRGIVVAGEAQSNAITFYTEDDRTISISLREDGQMGMYEWKGNSVDSIGRNCKFITPLEDFLDKIRGVGEQYEEED